MRDDYVWDRSGDAEPDLVAFERSLATLRHTAPMVELPEQSFVASGPVVRSGWARPIVLGAVLSSALTVLLIWGFLRLWPLRVQEADSVEEADTVSVSAPPRRSRRAEERARLQRLEVLMRELQDTVDDLNAAVAKLTAEQERQAAQRDSLTNDAREVQKWLREKENKRLLEDGVISRMSEADKRSLAEELEKIEQDQERNERLNAGVEWIPRQPSESDTDPLASGEPSPGAKVDCILDPDKCKPKQRAKQDKLTSQDIKDGVAPHKANATRCGAKHGGLPGETVTIKLSIAGATGKVTQSVATGHHRSSPLGECVARALSHAEFPRFNKESLGVQYPIRF